MKPRDYQHAGIESTFNYFTKGGKGNPILVMPTGTGKSVVIAGTAKRALSEYSAMRILKATHVKELVGQNAEKLLAMWPGAPLGVVAAGLNRYEFGMPITFGSIQTLVNYVPDLGHIDWLLVDECHMVGKKDSSMYQQLITGLRAKNPHLRVIGYTATDFRLGQGKITGDDGIFTDVCFDMCSRQAFKWLFDQGYLCRLQSKRTGAAIDLDGIKITAGEYNEREMQERAMTITEQAVQEAIAMGEGRKTWLVFASGIAHAQQVADLLNLYGIDARCVHSKMKSAERDANIADFKAGKYTALVNNGVLTTGFDHPAIDYIVMLRATMSAALWVQMLGRGTRPLFDTLYKHWYMPGVQLPVVQGQDGKWHYDLETTAGRLAAIATSAKTECLVADFGGNAKRLGPINDPVVPHKKGKGKGGVAPVRYCDACGSENHASAAECEWCGEPFPRHPKISTTAGTAALIAEDEPVKEYFDVTRVEYKASVKPGRPTTLEVTYWSKMRMFREHVCLSHPGVIAYKAKRWWEERSSEPCPPSTEEALNHLKTLKAPARILVWVNKRYPEVVSYVF